MWRDGERHNLGVDKVKKRVGGLQTEKQGRDGLPLK